MDMKIAIDGTTLCDAGGGSGAGIEHYTWSIVSALFKLNATHEYFLIVTKELSEPRLRLLLEGTSNVCVLRQILPTIPFVSRHIFLPLRLWISQVRVLFSPFGQIPYFWKGKSVITVHDVMIYEHPEWFSQLGEQNFSTRVIVPMSIEKAQKIIAVSNSTNERLNHVFPDSEEKTVIVYEGVEPPQDHETNYVFTRFPFERDMVLFLGTIEPRKNLDTAFQAFHTFLEERPDLATTVRFVVAGKRGWNADDTFELANRINDAWSDLEPDGVIRFLGTVTEEEKWSLLRRASVFLFPSLFEGFGLPILEAMSVGTPVITTQEGALAEVGGDSVITVDPFDVQGMSFAIAQCLLVPEGVEKLCWDGIERAKQFSWERAAQETLRILEQVGKNQQIKNPV